MASEPSRQASRPPHQFSALYQLLTLMALPTQVQTRSDEADIQLTISSLNREQFNSERNAIHTFNVPRSTLRNRRAGKPAQRDCQPNSKKLTQLEEEVIVRYILDLDQRGFAPTYAAIRVSDMRGAERLGIRS
jgi:hypothetical protein